MDYNKYLNISRYEWLHVGINAKTRILLKKREIFMIFFPF